MKCLSVSGSPTFDSSWWLLLPLAAVLDDSAFKQRHDDMSVVFVEYSNDIGNREFLIDEQVADGEISLCLGIEVSSIGRHCKLRSTNLETIVEGGDVTTHKGLFFSRATFSFRRRGRESLRKTGISNGKPISLHSLFD